MTSSNPNKRRKPSKKDAWGAEGLKAGYKTFHEEGEESKALYASPS